MWKRARERLGGGAVVPQSDGVYGVGMALLQASTRDDHGSLCRNRRVFGMLERVRGGCEREDRSGGQGGERARGADGLVWLTGVWAEPGWAGCWSLIAVAVRRNGEGGADGRAVGDAARSECIQGD